MFTTNIKYLNRRYNMRSKPNNKIINCHLPNQAQFSILAKYVLFQNLNNDITLQSMLKKG